MFTQKYPPVEPEDIFDGDTNFSISMWVKGWPSAGNSLINKNQFDPAKYGDLRAWFDATEPSSFSTSNVVGGPTPSNGDTIKIWHDLSGNGHHAVLTAGTGTYSNAALKGDTIGIDGAGMSLSLTNSASAFDAWDKMTIIMLYEWAGAAGTTWQSAMHKGGTSWSSTSWCLQTMNNNSPNTQGTGFVQAIQNGTNNYRLNGNSKTYASSGNPKIIVARYQVVSGTGYMKLWANGDVATSMTAGVQQQSKPTSPVVIGGASHDYGDIMIFNDGLADADLDVLEGYIAHKYGIQSLLVSGHTYGSTDPAAAGWAIKRSSTNSDSLTMDLIGAGGEFSSNVPINDDKWHHLVTTFGSGNKKIYVDGQQVATAAQTGTVTATDIRLVFGDRLANSPTQPSIDDLRFYRGVLTAAEVAAIYNNGSGDVGQPKFAITSPSSINATVGRSVSYQITADPAYAMTGYNSTITYELLNKPSWLDVNGSTGMVTGTPPSAGTYSFQVKASNTLGSGLKDITLTAGSYSNWNYSLSFTTDYNSGTALEDWNMLVRFSEKQSTGMGNSGFRYSQAASNGGDLRFVSKTGEELKYEIANWNTAGESQVWVRVPSLGIDANFTAYWGNSNAGMPSYANDGSVWDGYFGVYHLESGYTTAKDSSAYGNDLAGVNAPTLVPSGLAGASYSTTSAANNGFLGTIAANTKAKEGTYTIWANTPSNPTDWKDFFGIEYNGDSNYTTLSGQ